MPWRASALVLGQAGIINAGGRERSKKEVCLANLRALAAAWQTYSSDNSGKVPVGDVYYSWAFPTSAGGPQLAWFEWPHPFPHAMPPTYSTNYSAAYPYSSPITQAVWEHAIAEGTLWKYVGDYNIYRCPDGDKGQYVTYSMSHSMNTYPGSAGPGSVLTIVNINQIIRPAERFVFLDAGPTGGVRAAAPGHRRGGRSWTGRPGSRTRARRCTAARRPARSPSA